MGHDDRMARDTMLLALQAVKRAVALDAASPEAHVLVLRFWADLGDDTIAELMGTTTSTVRATAARALTALRSDGTLDLREAR